MVCNFFLHNQVQYLSISVSRISLMYVSSHCGLCKFIDGKHVRIKCPKLSGTLYYNCKGFYSVALMAVCGANYCFSLIDIGQYGSNNDSGVLAASKMGELFEDNEMNLPSSSKISESDDFDFLYFLLGDETFQSNPG